MSRILISTLAFAACFIALSSRRVLANPGRSGRVPTIAPGGHGGHFSGMGGGGSMGLSFGGGRGGIHYGMGGGGIHVGIGGRRHGGSRRHRRMVEEPHDPRHPPNHDPGWKAPVPEIHAPEIHPTLSRPHPTTPPTPPAAPNVQPVPLKPLSIPPEPNPIQAVAPNNVMHSPTLAPQKRIPEEVRENFLITSGRLITAEEIERADHFFQERLNALAQHLESKLPATRYDREQLVQLLVAKRVPARTQVQIVDALDRGDHKKAQRLWMSALPCCWVPFGPSPGRDVLLKIRLAIEQRRLSSIDMRELAVHIHPASRAAETPPEEACCGADDLVAQLEQEVRINMALTETEHGYRDTFDKPTEYGKPKRGSRQPGAWMSNRDREPEQLLASISSGHSNGGQRPGQPLRADSPNPPNAYRKPAGQDVSSESAPLPTGRVNIIYHPKLPDRQVVVVNPRTVMVGTGGQGVFHMEAGYVAEALGNRLASAPPLPGKQVEPVEAGILVLNPTDTRIQFKMGGRETSLAAGARQLFRANSSQVISFDRGGGTKTVRYRLREGTYRFKIDSDGWNLLKTKYEIAISNQGNFKPFYYSVRGKQAVVEVGKTRNHTSDYPVVIHFDRGNGTMTKQVYYEKKKGTLQVAINPNDNYWDLHEVTSETNQHSILKRNSDFVPAF